MLANYLVGKQRFLIPKGQTRPPKQRVHSLFSCFFLYSFILKFPVTLDRVSKIRF